MRKQYLILLALAFPFAASAQVTNAENYTPGPIGMPGDQIHNMNCSVPAGGPGGSGTSQTWDFSSVVDSTQVTTYVYADTANIGDIILAPTPAPIGTPVHPTTTQNLLLGYTFGTYSFTYTPGVLLAERSFNYGSTDNLSYAVGGIITGTGSVDFNCDGSGTLITPSGTYANAYRTVYRQHEFDSNALATISIDNVSYVWYDANHKAPLFRIDSTRTVGTGLAVAFTDTSGVPTAQYQQALFPAFINNLAATEQPATANISNNSLTINASLEAGRQYDISVFSIAGQLVYQSAFNATGSLIHFNMGKDLAAGNYFVNINKKGSNTAPIIIKTIKE